MKRNWSTQELERDWSLSPEEREQLKPKRPIQQLGLAVLVNFLKLEGRFPTRHRDVPTVAVRYVCLRVCRRARDRRPSRPGSARDRRAGRSGSAAHATGVASGRWLR